VLADSTVRFPEREKERSPLFSATVKAVYPALPVSLNLRAEYCDLVVPSKDKAPISVPRNDATWRCVPASLILNMMPLEVRVFLRILSDI
jgi:hypothetical protein